MRPNTGAHVNATTMIHLRIGVNRYFGRTFSGKEKSMHDRKVTPDMVPVIKLARSLGYPYSALTGYFPGLNFGRVADIMKGRRYPDIPPADELPADFPAAH